MKHRAKRELKSLISLNRIFFRACDLSALKPGDIILLETSHLENDIPLSKRWYAEVIQIHEGSVESRLFEELNHSSLDTSSSDTLRLRKSKSVEITSKDSIVSLLVYREDVQPDLAQEISNPATVATHSYNLDSAISSAAPVSKRTRKGLAFFLGQQSDAAPES
jgi:hypothetical protein